LGAKSTTIAKATAGKSARAKIFTADRTGGKDVKPTQVPPHSPILPTVRAKGLQHLIHTSGTPHGT